MNSHKPTVLAVSGLKNSGKTTLIEKLVPCLNKKGYEIAVIKHDGHSFVPDTPGTDSYRFFQAGAMGTAVFDDGKWTMTKRSRLEVEQAIQAFQEADFILLEGFKYSAFPKLVLQKKGEKLTPDGTWLALIGDCQGEMEIPCYSRNDVDGIAEFIIRCRKEGVEHV